MEEIWKDVEGFEGLYKISNLGRIKNVEHFVTRSYIRNGIQITDKLLIKEKILRVQEKYRENKKDTYYGYSLRKDGKYYNVLIHRLVAKAFVPNPNNYTIVNHKDCDTHNNISTNLEWCTHQHNNLYANRIDKARTSYLNNPKNHKPITLMDKDYKELKRYNDINDMLKDNLNFKRNSIYNAIALNRLYLKKYRMKYT